MLPLKTKGIRGNRLWGDLHDEIADQDLKAAIVTVFKKLQKTCGLSEQQMGSLDRETKLV